jgi:hypothetical protein
MAIDFPNSPSNGEIYTVGSRKWRYDGQKWIVLATSEGDASISVSLTAPLSPAVGDFWFESDTGKTFVYYDSYWVEMSSVDGLQGANGSTGPEGGSLTLTTKGDILTKNYSSLARLAAGSNGQVLSANSSSEVGLEWVTPTVYATVANLSTLSNTVTSISGNADTLSNTVTTLSGNVSTLSNTVSLKANIASPDFTGVPTAPTANSTTNTTQIATTAYVKAVVGDLINSAPAALDTLGEIATSLANNSSLSSTLTTSIALKAPLADPTFTGNVSGITKTMVGLGSVDNTTDLGKPISNATQTALNLKADLSGPTFTGNVSLPSTTSIGNVTSTEISYVDGVTSAIQTQLNAKAPLSNPTFTGTVSGITKSMVGLGSVDNTADTAKPVSTAQQTALNLKANLESPTFTGNITEDFTHGIVHRLRLQAGNNGLGTGEVSFHSWISEPAATWTGCGIARNRINQAGFPRPNTGITAQMIRFDESGNIIFYMMNSSGGENTITFDTSGNAYKPGGGSWSANSDIRLKNNVRDYNKGTAELMQIRVREWEHNGKGGIQAGYKGLGVVADEIELVLPGTVHTYEGKLNPEDEETTDIKSVNATEITWLMVKTIQEQQAVIEQLKTRIEALESTVE